MARIVLIDNQDSFVYNLVESLAQTGHDYTVYRNTVPVETVLADDPALIVLSPGPGHPRQAGAMMELIRATLGTVPILGICLGFQALLEHYGTAVVPCGPVHGKSENMHLTDAGAGHPVFAGLAVDVGPEKSVGREVPVARYHSLASLQAPAPLMSLATTETDIGDVVMAAETTDGMALGLQFHPESLLTPAGPTILNRSIAQLLNNSKKGDIR